MTEEKKNLRIGFMGTPDFATQALKAINASAHDVVCVYTQPPRPKGRGHKLQPSAVHAYADEQNIPVLHPKSLKSADVQAEFAAQGLDVAVVAAYGLILPKPILDAPKHGCINIHASLLPRWRGASPIQRAIWAGDAQSGVTLIQMNEGLDTGPEIMKTALDLGLRETASSLHDRLAALGAEMIVETLDKLAIRGQLSAKEQENDGVEYAHMLKKDDGRLDWTQSATQIDCQIRALNPWPGVWAQIPDGQRLKILSAEPIDPSPPAATVAEKNRPVGMVLNKTGHVQCGQNTVLRLERVQPAGKQAMDLPAALNGGYLKIDEVLG